MKGLLVVNEFVNSEKFTELFNMLEAAAITEGVELEIKRGGEVWAKLCANNYSKMANIDFVLFWDKDIKLAKALEGTGIRVFNSAKAIANCDDKALTYLELKKHSDIAMPKTLISPKKFHNDGLVSETFISQIEESIGYPCVIKECLGSFGQQVYLANTRDEAIQIIQSIGDLSYMVQEYIESSKGHDIRIQVVGENIVAAMYRYNDNDFRANVSNGGAMKPYDPTTSQSQMAIKVCKYLGLDFAGVDILFGDNDEPILCEVNSNAHFKNLFDCTGVNTAEYIIRYIKEALA